MRPHISRIFSARSLGRGGALNPAIRTYNPQAILSLGFQLAVPPSLHPCSGRSVESHANCAHSRHRPVLLSTGVSLN